MTTGLAGITCAIASERERCGVGDASGMFALIDGRQTIAARWISPRASGHKHEEDERQH